MEESDLQQAITELADLVKSKNPADRQKALMEKSLAGDASDEEKAELADLLKGGGARNDEDDLVKSAVAGLDPEANEDLENALEVSEYLRAHHKGTVDALAAMGDHIEKSDTVNHAFQLGMAKAVVKQGELLMELQKSIDAMASQPAGAPRAAKTAPQAQAIQKSMAGQPAGDGQTLSKAQVLGLLEEMNLASDSGMSKSGEDLTNAIAKLESGNKITPALAEEVRAFAATKGS